MEESRFFELDARVESMRSRRSGVSDRALGEFGERLDIGWVYHDNALEGIVLSYTEIREAIDRKMISDVSLISSSALSKLILIQRRVGETRIGGAPQRPSPPFARPLGPTALVRCIDADNIALELDSPTARSAREVPEIGRRHKRSLPLFRAPDEEV